VNRGLGDFGNLKALGQKPDAPINLAQALFAVDVVTVFAPVAIAGRPVNDLDNTRPLSINQAQQFCAQTLVTNRRDVVLAASRKRRQNQAINVVIVVNRVRLGFFGKGFAHGRPE